MAAKRGKPIGYRISNECSSRRFAPTRERHASFFKLRHYPRLAQLMDEPGHRANQQQDFLAQVVEALPAKNKNA